MPRSLQYSSHSLVPKSPARQVEALMRREPGLDIKLEKLQTKYESYASFYIRGDKKVQDMLLCADMGSKFTLIKQYEEIVLLNIVLDVILLCYWWLLLLFCVCVV